MGGWVVSGGRGGVAGFFLSQLEWDVHASKCGSF